MDSLLGPYGQYVICAKFDPVLRAVAKDPNPRLRVIPSVHIGSV